MHTYQIADTVLDNYRKGKLGEERIRFLKEQVHEQGLSRNLVTTPSSKPPRSRS